MLKGDWYMDEKVTRIIRGDDLCAWKWREWRMREMVKGRGLIGGRGNNGHDKWGRGDLWVGNDELNVWEMGFIYGWQMASLICKERGGCVLHARTVSVKPCPFIKMAPRYDFYPRTVTLISWIPKWMHVSTPKWRYLKFYFEIWVFHL
jgi:hypothetical protein